MMIMILIVLMLCTSFPSHTLSHHTTSPYNTLHYNTPRQAIEGVVFSHTAPRQASGWCVVRTVAGAAHVPSAGYRITPGVLPPKTRQRILQAEKSRNSAGCYGHIFTAERTYEQQQQHARSFWPYLHYLFLFLYSAV